MVKYFIISIFLILGVSSSAQEKMIFPNWRIGFTPSTLISNPSGIQFSIDKRLNDNINLTAEYAFLLASSNESKGYSFRPGLELLLIRKKWISYVCGVHYTHSVTQGQQKLFRTATNGEFNFISYRDVENKFFALNLSNSILFKMSKRAYVSLEGGIGSGRKTEFIPWKETVSFSTTGNTPQTKPSLLYYLEMNFSFAFGL